MKIPEIDEDIIGCAGAISIFISLAFPMTISFIFGPWLARPRLSPWWESLTPDEPIV
jgi:hypothetical protein